MAHTGGELGLRGADPARRTIVKGAAWAVPVITVAGAAPAMAASPIPPNGLNGWVQLRRDCSSNANDFVIDGRGSFTGGGDDDRGIWTFVPDPNADITAATIVFFFTIDGLTFTNSSGPGWSNLVRNAGLDGASPAPGYFAYATSYTGTWTYFAGSEAWVADSDPYWIENDMPGFCRQICAYARRSITVNEETVTFTRGPVCV